MKFFECKHCGNRVLMMHDSGVPMICCGEEMHELVAGSVDAAQEKHVPDVKVSGTTMNVQVGSVAHPMTPEHYIMWILVEQGAKVQFVKLEPTDEPKATFVVEPGAYTVYEFCNLHGLWKAEGKA